jgi:acyl-CoA synthetase (AMP-forming)/AMP-acid ligase II
MLIHESKYPPIALRDCTITERVFEGLVHRPDAAVLIDGPSGRAMTAAELIHGIKVLAGGLSEHGFGAGHCVALMAPNVPEFCTVFHAVCWAGGTITTINPTYTATEVNHQLNDSGAELLVTVPSFIETARKAAAGTSVREIAVIGDADRALPLASLMGDPIAHQVPVDVVEHVAVLPYSSGTTGLPKGVMLTHRNLVANVDQGLAVIPFGPDEETPAFLPFFHIYGLEVFLNTSLAAGASVVTLPRFDLELLLELTQKHRARRLFIVPPVALALAKHPIVDQYDLSSVEQVLSGAAPLGADLETLVANRIGCTMTQGYGMTELSPVSHAVPPDAPRPGAAGLAVPDTRCRIVDVATGEDLPTGQEGELWVQGPQVMKGYLRNPSATAANVDADGWLRTGDVGMIDSDGYLFVRDRVKELIKFKGFQVAPAELEAALMTHDGVADAAVVGIADEEAGEVPMAFIVARGQQPSLGELQMHLEQRLAHFKQIRRVQYVEEIPKSASGKILRRILRETV